MTAMDTLAAIGADEPEMPRFDDGMININELLRTLAEALVNEVMDVQAEDACADGNQRNGYRERTLLASVGRITLRIPKLRRGSYFPEDLIGRYSRVDRAVIAAVAEMVTSGVSTRKVEKVARTLGVGRMSASQVSRICESLDSAVADLQGRMFEGVAFPYLWIDATYLKCRDGGHVSSCAMVTAIGAASDGHRVLLGMDAADTEDYASWRSFLLSLRERGVSGVRCATSDAHAGLRRAIEEVFPGSAWQRCVVHLERNVCALARSRRERALVGSVVKAVFAESDPALVRELYHLAIDEIGAVSAAAGELLEEAEADALAYLDFPPAHHRRLRTNNVQERMNREIKRRANVVQVFPSRKSLVRLLGAVLSEMDEDWSARRWFTEESISEVFEDRSHWRPGRPAAYEGSAAEHAARIISVVMADEGAVRRAA